MLNFPPWTTRLRSWIPCAVGGGLLYLVVVVWYGFSPLTTDVGYAPVQPVAFSHALHNGELGISCYYCHSDAEKAAHANIPPTQTCMNCHARIRVQDAKLLPVRDSWATGMPIPWVRVHDLPHFVYFNHSAHVTRGISCISCHGRVDTMDRVVQVEKLSMGWCLDCHRQPEKHLRPTEFVTQLDWEPPEGQRISGKRIKDHNHIHPPEDCSTCHR